MGYVVRNGTDIDIGIVVSGGCSCQYDAPVHYCQDFMTETNDEKTKRWFYHGYNRNETIDALMEKLNERDARIAALEKELADLKKKQFPSFITQSTFCK